MKPNWSNHSGINKLRPERLGVGLVLLLLIGLLVACGDSTSNQATATENPFVGPVDPQPSPSSTVPTATIPSLSYIGATELKAGDQFSKTVIDNIGRESISVGQFKGEKVSFYKSTDSNLQIEAYYRKLMISNGWTTLNRLSDNNATMLVFQKTGTKIVIEVQQVFELSKQPAEFQSQLKEGDRLILVASGMAIEPTGNQVTIELENGGTIIAELYADVAPKTVENFQKLANQGFYDGLTFHRIEPGFVVQGGDPKGDGTGGPGYTIPGEFSSNNYTVPDALKIKTKHVYGSLAMARATDPNSAGSQFYIVTGQETSPSVSGLNGNYAVFGKVTHGMDLVEKIQKGDKIKSIKVEVK